MSAAEHMNGAAHVDPYVDDLDGWIPCDDDAPASTLRRDDDHEARTRAAVVRSSEHAELSRWEERRALVTTEWVTTKPRTREYLFLDTRTGRGAIPRRGVAILGAAGGAGKSFLEVDAAVSIATKAPLAGVLMPENAGRVLIVSAEDPHDEYQRRIYDVAKAKRVTSIPEGSIEIIDVHDAHVPLLTPEGEPTDHARALVEYVERHGPFDLVEIDPVARLAGANIDGDNTAATALITVLESIATAAKGLVLAAHHTSQLARRGGIIDATALRGATALGDGARMVLVLTVEEVPHADPGDRERLGEIVTLHRAKANHVRRWEPIELRRNEHGVLVPLDSYDGQIIAEARAVADPTARRAAARETERGARHEAIDSALRAVLAERKGIGTRELRAAMAARLGRCSHDAVDEAIERVGVRREQGPGKAVRHYLEGSDR